MPSIATTPRGPLGCGSYVCRLVNDGNVIFRSRRAISVAWGRRTGEPSNATLTLPVQGTDLTACCEGQNKIDPLRTELIVTRNGIDIWQGWVMRDVSFHRDNVIVNASDILKWTDRRVLDDNHNFSTVATDLTTIALDYFGDSNLVDLPFVIQSELSGITAKRKVLASEHKYASVALTELYETGLDVTVVAGIVFLGNTVQTCDTLLLRDTHIDGDPEIKTDGDLRATRVIVKGANGIVSIKPDVPPDVCFRSADHVVDDPNILDQESADARASELVAQMSTSYPYFLTIPEGSSLDPKSPVHVNALVPGNIFHIESSSLCVPVGMSMRLIAVDGEAAAGSEQIRVTFEPLEDELMVEAA